MDNKVIFNKEDKIKIDADLILFLKVAAEKNDSKKVTFCLHKNHEEGVHEMINVYPKGLYVRPHKHPVKTETKHMIEGRMLMLMFDDSGNITDRFILGQKDSGECFAYRIEKNYYHSIIPLTDTIVFHEIINGPYAGTGGSIFPEWAPDINDVDGIKVFLKSVME